MKTKIKTNIVVCDTCKNIFNVKEVLLISTSEEKRIFCLSCLSKSYRRLEGLKHRDDATEKLMLEIKKFLKSKDIKPWLKN